ncbi:MAG: FG-GAP-like repeat-containing protein [Janthinobacterium lividum]
MAVPFSQSISTSTAGNIKIFSPQYRGRRTATASTSGSTVTLTPTASSGSAAFRPGETVFVTVPATVQSTGGAAAVPQVYQFTTAVGGGNANFVPGTDPAVGSAPISVAAGDVDGDGDLDLLTANSGTNTVSVRLNDGSGNYTAPATNPNPAVGNNPQSVVLGDVDGDGDLDLLAANSNGTVSVRLNDGSGSYSAPATNPDPAVGNGPQSVALGDVDGDGDLDLFCANSADNTVSVRLNDGSGNFSSGSDPVVGLRPYSLAVGDVDGDSDLDLLTANATGNSVSVRLNDGNGNFTAPATNAEVSVGIIPRSIAVGDVDGDGDLDLLTCNADNTVSVRLNDGSGSYSAPITNPNPAVGNNPYSVVLGDVDGDGDLDLLASNADNVVNVRLNDGTGNFTTPATNPNPPVGNNPQLVVLGDVDGDGDLDLLTANYGSGTVSVRLNQPLPAITSFTPTSGPVGTSVTLTGTNLGGVTSVSFHGTAQTTITSNTATSLTVLVPSGATTGTLTVTTASGTSAPSSQIFTVPALLLTSRSPVRNAVAGSPSANLVLGFDQALAPATAGAVRVFSSQRGGQLVHGGNATASGSTLTVNPANDLRPGETVFVSVPNTVKGTSGAEALRQVYQYTAAAGAGPGSFSPGSEVAVGTTYSAVAADVDGDGDLDLLAANLSANMVSVRLNNGSGTFSGTTDIAVGNGPISVVAADIDGDGDLDMLVANAYGSTVSVRLNNGSGSFSGTTDVPAGAVAYSVAAADIDGDGDLDMLVANLYGNSVSVRLNDGSGIFSGTTDVAVGNGPASVVAADVDGDGDLDLLTANTSANTVSVRLNDSNGTFSGTTDLPVGTYPISVAAADVDGDGDLDILVANLNANTVSVRLNDGSGIFSGTTDVAVGNGPASVAAADVDGDGDLDLLTGNDNINTVSVRLNNGSGTFSGTTDITVDGNTASVAAADVDGDGDLDLLTANTSANTVSVRLNQAPPTITSFTPTSGPVGTSVTLMGTYLANATGLTLNGAAVPLTNITANTATTLTFTVPARATTGPLTVTTAAGTSAASPQPFTVTPSLSNLVLSAGAISPAFTSGTTSYTLTVPGTTAATTVTPTNAQTAGGTITVNGTAVASGAASGSIALAPGSNTITVVVNPDAGAAPATTYTVTVTRTPCVVTAQAQNVSVQLAANGTATVAASAVDNGSSSTCGAVTLNLSKTAFTCADLGTNAVTLTATDSYGGSGTAMATVTITAPPTATLSGATPNPAPVGTTVSVTGTNLSGATALTVNGASAPIMSLTATGFTFVVPSGGTGTGNLVVSVPCGQSLTRAFTIPPTITSFTPTSGQVGASVTIAGANLGGITALSLNGTSVLASLSANTATSATFTVPVGATTGLISLTTPGGTATTSGLTPASFTVLPFTVATLSPTRNALTAALSTTVGVTFSDNPSAATVGNIKVFSTEYRGQRTATASISGNTATLTPTVPATGSQVAAFKPGETVQVTVPATVKSTAGASAVPQVYQFTVAAGGTGSGNFVAPVTNPNPTFGNASRGTALADVNNDGKLDLLVGIQGSSSVAVRLNDGSGGFSGSTTVSVGGFAFQVATGDVNGDGNIDFVTTNSNASTVSVRLGNGAGGFTNAPTANPTVGSEPYALALGDIDADGDLDLVVANGVSGTVSVLVNNGSGNFTLRPSNNTISVGDTPRSIGLGDVDNDGDLDVLVSTYTTNAATGTVSVLKNDGTGSFGTPVNPTTVGGLPWGLAVGDLNADGYLDFVVSNFNDGTVSVRLNNGAGSFGNPTTTPTLTVRANPIYVALGDIDADGDLDLVVPAYNNGNPSGLNVRLNDGTGNFTSPNTNPDPTAGSGSVSVALGDIDGDGDQDAVISNYSSNSVSIRFNQALPTITSFTPTSGPLGTTISITGTNLTGATAITFSGSSGNVVTTGYTVNAAGTQITGIVVPAGAITGPLSVTSALGTSPASGQPFTVTPSLSNLVLSAGAISPTFASGTTSYTLTVPGTTTSTTVTPTSTQASSTIMVNGVAVTSGTASGSIALNPGANTIAVVMSPGGGGPSTTYTVTVTRTPCVVTAQAQNVSVQLAANGTASVTATQVNNGSSSTCGTVTLSLSKMSFTCADLGSNPVTLTVTDSYGGSATASATVTVAVPAMTMTTWNGAASTDWNNCANWSYGQVPTAGISAVIPAGLARYPGLPAGTYATNGLTLASGASLTTAAGATLQVSGDWANNGGTATLDGGVTFTGTAAQTIGGSASTAFGAVTVDKAGGTLTLGHDLAIGTSLSLTIGTLTTTATYKVALGSTAIISESETSYVAGAVEATRDLSTAGTGSSFGGLGLTLTPAASSTALPGSTLVRRVTGSPVTGAGGSTGIGRYFVITPVVDANLSVTMVFGYFEHELNSIPETNLRLFKSDNGTSGPWQPQASTTADAQANTVTKPSIASLSTWTLGNAAAPLPVQLVGFTATAQGNRVALAWRTASEVNSARFEVERSADGVTFAEIGRVAAQGTKTTATDYALLDKQLPTGATTLYYRLRQIDLDGTAAYSPVRVVALAGAALRAYPVPAHGGQVLTITGASAGAALEVLDALGRRIAAAPADAAGTAQLPLPAGLAAGVYVLRAGEQVLRLVVE